MKELRAAIAAAQKNVDAVQLEYERLGQRRTDLVHQLEVARRMAESLRADRSAALQRHAEGKDSGAGLPGLRDQILRTDAEIDELEEMAVHLATIHTEIDVRLQAAQRALGEARGNAAHAEAQALRDQFNAAARAFETAWDALGVKLAEEHALLGKAPSWLDDARRELKQVPLTFVQRPYGLAIRLPTAGEPRYM